VEQDNIATARLDYAPDLMLEEGLKFIERNKERPFFLYFASTLPHANNERGRVEGNGMEIPSDHPYSERPWPQPQKNHAAMITRFDADVGRLVGRLVELGLDKQTIVFISSDNGPHKEGGADPSFFASAGPLRGFKRDLTDGGIRVPMIVCWPGHLAPGTNDQPWWFADFLPTAAQVARVELPPELHVDGESMLALLTGPRAAIPQRERVLYWEFHERGFHQAVRLGRYKGIRHGLQGRVALYDVISDLHEDRDLAGNHPKIVARIEAAMNAARTESAEFPVQSP